MPTGNPPPPNRPWPDTARNITKAPGPPARRHHHQPAFQRRPAGYGVAEQLANFDTIVGEARPPAGRSVCLPSQPRNLSPKK
ncbi:MAG: hypothetical protein IPM36_20825 [Lewinellaceae bacterium]|nr:hypothetical protein [Lewinellaceae bacterium]